MLSFKTTIQQAAQALTQTDKAFIQLLSSGSMKVEYYKPDKFDFQTPHKQDELYIIISGSGNFIRDKEVLTFNPHDVLFVPAGMPHCFENFTEDFATWVIFYGADGGEK